jgi:hypothetical protein
MNEELTSKQEPEEEAGADLPEGRSGGRRGETARQLIRHAKQASRSASSYAEGGPRYACADEGKRV